MALPSIALPGTLLGPATKYLPGPGTHIHESQIYASIPGAVTSSSNRSSTTSTTSTPKPDAKSKPLPLLSISRPSATNSPTSNLSNTTSTTILPEISSTVLARITRLGTRFASAEILVVNDVVCSSTFQGMIRREDVRATEKDKVTIADSFRVGDLVRGVVISLGDQSNYYLETARNELGVVMATSEDGNVMFPVSWREFVDGRTGRREARKVAKPF